MVAVAGLPGARRAARGLGGRPPAGRRACGRVARADAVAAHGLSRAARDAAQRLLGRLGYAVVAAEAARPAPLERAALLREAGVEIVLDVGASEGEFGRTLRAEGYAGRIVSFEPLAAAFAELERRAARDGAWGCRRLALGAEDGSAELHVAANRVSSSLLPVTGDHVRVAPGAASVRGEAVPLARLDTIAPALVRPGERAFLKLDVQGAELAALRGGEQLVGRLAGLECELSLVALYEGQPLLTDVVGWLGGHGLALVSLAPALTDPASGELLQLDALFVPRSPAGWRERL